MTRYAFAAILLWMLAACAQVREPQGGPKDSAPPKLLTAQPPDGSTRFSGNRIVLHFDEKVKLDRVREKLLVSPPLGKAPDVTVEKGTDVVIGLNAPLAANTTYTFNIGEAVKDLSEGNPADGLSFVVSTGAYVDSLSVTGTVVDAFSGLPAPDVLVLLHAANDTGDVRTTPPGYFTRTKPDGSFRLTHLRSGPMHLTALRDRNANYRYDLPNEEIAFLDGTIDPTDTLPQHLYLFQPLSATQFIADRKVLEDRGWRMVMARPAGEVTLQSLDRAGGTLAWWPEWNKARDTVVFWPSDTTLLNGQRFIISENGAPLDTLIYRPVGAMPFNLVITSQHNPITGALSLVSSRPVAAVDTGDMVLTVDSARIPLVAALDSGNRRAIAIELHLEKGKEAALTLYPKAVVGAMGGTNDTTRLRLGVPDPRTLGKLKVELATDSSSAPQGPFLLQLTAAQGQVVREARLAVLPVTVEWTGLRPGSYGLKLIGDRNGDQQWTTGSFGSAILPERVYLLKDPVVIRAGWAVETNWKPDGL